MTFKNYQFSINVKTNHDPRKAIFEIVNQLKGILPVLSIDYKLIEDRDVTVHHHGGINETVETKESGDVSF
tara:strand:- start:3034 stop:3246 length:213 start_codon:yes stop_codon:yes gene_type:complete